MNKADYFYCRFLRLKNVYLNTLSVCRLPTNSNMSVQEQIAAGTKKLVDMDWRFGVTAANSENENIGATFLQLKLVLEGAKGKTERVYMGMFNKKDYCMIKLNSLVLFY